MAFSVGIDLGTTNTVVSTARRGINSNIEVLTESIDQIVNEEWGDMESSTLLPSVLYVNNSLHNVGLIAKEMKGQTSNRVIFNSKNYMGESDYRWEIDDKEYTPELVASYFLSAVRKHLMQKYKDEESINTAVITVPASFNIDQRNATTTAAKIAGFNGDITLISEPTAAILDFINEQSKIEDCDKFIDLKDFKNILVFDLGGGTCDVAVLKVKIKGKDIYVEEVAVSPHTLIGGANFDAYAVEGIIKDFEKENNISLTKELDKEDMKKLKRMLVVYLEKAKIFFSGKYFQYNDGNTDLKEVEKEISRLIGIPNVINGKPFKLNLTMERYNQYISSLLNKESKENIIAPIDATLRSSNLCIDEIDYVFCVGGMTKYPAVWNTISQYFSKEPLKFTDSMESVSRGASIYHYYNIINIVNYKKIENDISVEENTINEGNNVIDITSTLPQTIYLNVKNGFPIPLIEAKSKAGEPIIHEDLIKVSSEIGIALELYAGSSIFDPDLKRLENVNLNFPVGVKVGSPVALKLEWTRKGILMFEAWIKDNPEIKINLTLEGNQILDEEIDEVKKEYGVAEVGGIM